MQILILEDDEAILYTIQIAISYEKEGSVCDTALSVQEAKELLYANRYDLVIADLMVDGSPCVNFISEVKRVQPWARLCVMSAWHNADKIIKDCNVDFFVPKPFELEIIEEILFAN